ncbi:hypothetical protein SPBR_03170 [Sporothrix brasiliensis 5110]|uniref:Uncharacterized protein n=1 Tax=Sporothrix brasiliensis 5110 TaxID=1398154 RepID=A0A0C2F030_9PEZI|nr:uncharacterized protein SPBR_03170 [Sporothrix brasiliensis 5110]KIH92134.1 hypothetical protein SPBR_03170 [Sporothrix brasiliensis 5110]
MPEHSKINIATQTRVTLSENRTIRCLYRTTLRTESRRSAVVIAWAQGHAEKFGQALMAGINTIDQGEEVQQQQQHGEGDEEFKKLNEEFYEEFNEEFNEKRNGQHGDEEHGKESVELEQPQQPTKESKDVINKKKHITGFDVKMNLVNIWQKNVLLCFDLFLEDCDAAMRSRVDQSLEEPIQLVFRKYNTYYVQRRQDLDSKVSNTYIDTRRMDKGARPLYSDQDNPPLYDNGRRIPDEERAQYGMSTFFETAGRPRNQPVRETGGG